MSATWIYFIFHRILQQLTRARSERVKVTSLNRPTYWLLGQRAVTTVAAHKCHFIPDGDRLSWVVTNSYGLNTVSDKAFRSYQA